MSQIGYIPKDIMLSTDNARIGVLRYYVSHHKYARPNSYRIYPFLAIENVIQQMKPGQPTDTGERNVTRYNQKAQPTNSGRNACKKERYVQQKNIPFPQTPASENQCWVRCAWIRTSQNLSRGPFPWCSRISSKYALGALLPGSVESSTPVPTIKLLLLC